ncbi:helix-turn-helix domain-containing protein [Enterococcus villorum]|uniref:DNA-binding protein n=2 Tax=Enterococcus villorum TaxID=112904 RepID=A0A511J1Q4_9ENTE|nr:helix-turn-helix domain-containing protein [Enterococcus villorum]EOH94658.1 hypothetical protein UAO_00048 [Enterococcus villorum ATCC 700913]EOW77033.1 hypothetical protein I591_02354 [Enterococcus villorum ATCC 700913]GEL91945.1 DNA-binding protein [Enterococcus villorum]
MVKKFQLLDSHDLFEYKLITYIFDRDCSVSKKELLENFFVTSRTLKTMIDSINERVTVYVNSGDIILFDPYTKCYFIDRKFKNLKINILSEYVTTSVNFKILDSILNDNHITVEKCIRQNAISRANFFRRLKQINNLLNEFNLIIRNCKLVGNEGQLQYFRQQFYQNIYPEKYLYLKTKHTSQLEKLIAFLEAHLESHFNYCQKAKLLFWFTYFIGRQKKSTNISNRLYNFVINKTTFHQFVAIIKPFFYKLGIQLSLSELAYTFIFMISNYLVPKHAIFWKHLLNESFSENDLIAKRLNILLYEFKKNNSHEEGDFRNYYLYGAHVNVCFFKGEIQYLDEEQLIDTPVVHKEQIRKTINQQFEGDGAVANEILISKYYLYMNIQLVYSQKIRIGIALYLDPMFTEYYFRNLVAELLIEKGICIEEYNPNGQYDLVITDSESYLTNHNYQQKCIFSTDFSLANETIKHLIQKIKANKK